MVQLAACCLIKLLLNKQIKRGYKCLDTYNLTFYDGIFFTHISLKSLALACSSAKATAARGWL